jgi:hypothetical protein
MRRAAPGSPAPISGDCMRSVGITDVAILPAATRAASLPSLAAGLLWVPAWVHLLMAHGTSQVNEQRLALGLTWLDSGRLIAPSLLLAAAAVWLLVRDSRHSGMRLTASVAIVGLAVASAGATLGFWTQPVGTYFGASRESGAAAIGGLLAMLGSGITAVGLVAMGIAAARVRLVSGWVAVLLPLAGLSTVPWLHESPWAIGFGIAWIGVGGCLAMAGRDGPEGRRWPSRPRVLPDWKGWAGRLAGVFALTSGLAYVAYFLLDASVRDVAIAAWNLLIIPCALYLGFLVARRGALLAAASTAAGIAASLLWAVAYRVPGLEPWWIGLAIAWWLGLGWLLLRTDRRLGIFTLVLGAAAGVDLVLTVLDAPMPIYALGGFKILLTNVWTLWLGGRLLRDPALQYAAGSGPPEPLDSCVRPVPTVKRGPCHERPIRRAAGPILAGPTRKGDQVLGDAVGRDHRGESPAPGSSRTCGSETCWAMCRVASANHVPSAVCWSRRSKTGTETIPSTSGSVDGVRSRRGGDA